MTSKDHNATPDSGGDHWLAIAEEEFVPATSGGRVESLNLFKAAAAAGIRLHVIVPDLTDDASVTAHKVALSGHLLEGIPRATGWRSHLSMHPYVFQSRPLPAGFVGRVTKLHAQDPFDVVLAGSFRVAHLGLALANAIDVPLVIRAHNRESTYFDHIAQESSFPRNVAYRVEAYKLRQAESKIHSAARVALFADISQSDAEWRAGRTTTAVIHVPPFINTASSAAPVDRAQREEGASCTLLFLGALDFPINVSGVRWFIQRCWPTLRLREDAIALHIVGRRAPSRLVDELVACGAQVTTDAPEVGPLLREADIFINPVQRGSGVNIKMVEAMQAGLPVVSTTLGARGLSWRDGQHLLTADSAELFTSAVGRLLDDRELRQRIGSAAQEFVLAELVGPRHFRRIKALAR
jgi:glycosyltransferase involved in cell wall biosynthesis